MEQSFLLYGTHPWIDETNGQCKNMSLKKTILNNSVLNETIKNYSVLNESIKNNAVLIND